MRSFPAAALPVFVLLIAFIAGGCAKPRPANLNVLVPAEGDRAARLVPLAPDWASATVRALRATPGCTGVELSQTQSGKRAIFAMFKDRASMIAWYRSAAHQEMVGKVSFYRDHAHTPGAGVAENAGPILVIATMTPVPPSEAVPAGTVLLSVELFAPLEGGVRFGGASLLPR